MTRTVYVFSLFIRAGINKILAPIGWELHDRQPGSKLKDIPNSRKAILSAMHKNYHIGCGGLLARNFLNIDMCIDGIEGRPGVPVLAADAGNAYAMIHDLRNGIPAVDGSLDSIYHSHFFEHLTNKEGEAFLRECYRCLAPGGSMRFAVPDFELWCRKYVQNDQEFFDWYRNTYLNWWTQYSDCATVFSGMLYNYGHRMAYDFASLSQLLAAAGFVDVKKKQWGVSDSFPDISLLESEDSLRRVESLVLQCFKPAPPRL